MSHLTHLAETFFLKCEIANGEHLIHQEDLRLKMGGDGKRQPHLHSRAVVLQRSVNEFGHFGKIDDVVELALDFLLPHAENRAVQITILPPCQLRMKSRADFAPASNATS